MKLIELSAQQRAQISRSLDEYDEKHYVCNEDGKVAIGIEEDGELVAGLDAEMTAFHIMYVSTVFVNEKYRRKGYGKRLMAEMEKRAKEFGANMIRLDTFDYQGKDFYDALGYERVGHYRNDQDDFEEFFYVKRI